jgi:Flp pilus assembly protein TadD
LLVRQGYSWSGNERNCFFLNTRNGDFATISSVSGFDYADDARAVAITDWDLDGRLDLWTSSRTGPRVRFFHNRNSSSNGFVAFKLRGVTCNRDAIGARLVLYLGLKGETKRIKTLRAGEGFLSQSSKWVSFGIGQETIIDHLVVHWPDGAEELFRGLSPNSRYLIQQGTGQATMWSYPRTEVRLSPSDVQLPQPSQSARIVTLTRPLVPPFDYFDARHHAVPLVDVRRIDEPDTLKGVLLSLWSSSCAPCLRELKEWSENERRLRDAGIDVVALCVDGLTDGRSPDASAAAGLIRDIGFPFRWGIATDQAIQGLDALHQSLVDLQSNLPLPCGFLLAPSGELVVMYKGRVDMSQLVQDFALLSKDAIALRAAAVPFEGTWITKPIPAYPQDVALKLVEQGKTDDAVRYLRSYLHSADVARNDGLEADVADIQFLLGRLLVDRGDVSEGLAAYQDAIRTNPHYRRAHINLADLLLKQKRAAEAIVQLDAALEIEPNDPSTLVAQGVAFAAVRNMDAATRSYRKALSLQPEHRQAAANLARLLHAQGEVSEAVALYRKLLSRDPLSVADANNLAWILATSPDEAIHNPTEAVQWAEKACDVTDHRDPRYLTTLAAAYSEARKFRDAILAANTAIRTAYANGNPKIAETVEKHLRYYEAGQSYQEGRRTTRTTGP